MRWFALALIPLLMAFDEPLDDPAAEARAQALMQEIRCVACENEPISQSAADIAGDMRVRVREMIADGASDQDVRAWFEARYGEFVLFRPPARGLSGLALWGLPFAFLLIGAAGLAVVNLTRRGDRSVTPVSPEQFDHAKETGD